MADSSSSRSQGKRADPARLENGDIAAAEQAPKARSLKQRLLSGAVWLIVGRICSVGSLLASHVLLGRSLPEQEYAAYLTASAAAIMLAVLVSFGTPKMLIRAIKLELKDQNTHAARAAVKSCLGAVSLIASIALLLFCSSTTFMPDDAKWRGITDYSLLVAGWAGLSAACLVASHALQAIDDFRSAALVGARNGGALANTVFFLGAWYAHSIGSLSLGFALSLQVILHVLALALAVLYLYRGFRGIERRVAPNGGADVSPSNLGTPYKVRWFLRESWPNFVVQITSMSIFDLQILLVSLFAAERAIADYGAALRFLGIVNAIHALTTSVISPFVAELIAQDKKGQLERVLRGSATLIAIPTLIATTLLVLFSESILSLSFGPEFVGGAWALRILLIAGTIAILAGSNSLTMILAGKQHQLMIYSVGTSLFYVIAALPMIQFWGIVGAALSVGVVFGIYNVWVTLLVKSTVGVWTVPTLDPGIINAAFRTVTGRRDRSSQTAA